MKRTTIALAISLALVAACGTDAATDTTPAGAGTTPGDTAASPTTAPGGIELDSSTMAQIRDEVASFSAELQANASAELSSAWQRLETELTLVADSLQRGETDVDMEPARAAWQEVVTAVEAEQDELSAEFQELWNDLRPRLEALLGA